METAIILGLYCGYIGRMENTMETAIILGLYWENENKRETSIIILELYSPGMHSSFICMANTDLVEAM